MAPFFEIDPLTGLIKARLQGDTVFDRDRGDIEHIIHVDYQDNYRGNGSKSTDKFFINNSLELIMVNHIYFLGINSNSTFVTLILRDVNDNAPDMPSPELFKLSVSEAASIVSILILLKILESIDSR